MLSRMLFTDKVFPLLDRALDAYSLRQKAIASNMANITTPGYRRMEVRFEDQLRDALNQTGRLRGAASDDGHLPLGRSDVGHIRLEVERPDDRTLASGVNNVDVDREMAELANNAILYNTVTNFMTRKVSMLRNSITGRTG